MEHKKYKKGVSPLIASVLLIAFTVAMGAIIMTWGRGFVQTQTERVNVESQSSAACSTSVDMQFLVVDGLKQACYTSTGFINFTIQNTGSENIYQLKGQVLDTNGNVYNNATDNFAIPTYLSTGNAARIQIRFAPTFPGVKSLTLFPVILPAGLDTNRTCSNFQLDVTNLRACY